MGGASATCRLLAPHGVRRALIRPLPARLDCAEDELQQAGNGRRRRFGLGIDLPVLQPQRHSGEALAYRSTREAGGSHHDAMGHAMMAYFDERPDEYSNPT